MNGRELTASDIEFNFHRYLGIGSGFSEASPFAGQLPKIESVTATDASTVVFKLAEPDLFALDKLVNNRVAWIYPPEVIQQYGDVQDWRNLVGTGPMELTDYVEGSSITWTKNPNYWGFDEKFPENRLPYVDEIVALIMPDSAARLAALRSGQIDTLGQWGDSQLNSIDQVDSLKRTDPDIKLWAFVTRSNNALRFISVGRPPFDDIRVRQALQMAVDRETIANTYFKGLADPTPHGIINNDDPLGTPFDEWPEEVRQYYRYDPERAKQLLAEAGYPDGLKTELKYFQRYDANYAELVVGYWAEIGVDVEMSIHSSPESQAILQGHTSDGLAHGENAYMGADLLHLEYFYRADSFSGYNNDGLGVNDPHMNALVDAAKAATTLEERNRLVKEGNLYAVGQHWHIDGPGPVPQFNVAQPWVKGYNGEVGGSSKPFSAAGLVRDQITTLLTRLWIDQDLKRELGF